MAMGSERSSTLSRPLHNFDLPGLRWGSQRFLRCSNVDPSTGAQLPVASGRRANANPNASHVRPVIGKRKERENFDDSPPDSRRRSDCRKYGFPPLPPETERSRRTRMPPETGGDGDGDGIAAVREKLMIDLQTETDKIKVAIFKEGLDAEAAENGPSFLPPPPPASRSVSSSAAEPDTRPWNLRTRRAACKAPTVPNGYASGGVGTSNGIAGTSPAKPPTLELMKLNSSLSPPRLRSGGGFAAALPGNEKKERSKFSVALSRLEIEEDFFAIAGRKPPRRPQKRLRHVQKTLDTLFPGLWLTEINADMYKVPETQ